MTYYKPEKVWKKIVVFLEQNDLIKNDNIISVDDFIFAVRSTTSIVNIRTIKKWYNIFLCLHFFDKIDSNFIRIKKV